MIKEAIGTGTSIDEAKENAILNLGAAPEYDVSIEVLETYKKKSFGIFGGTLAKVRAYYEIPDEEIKEEKVVKEEKPAKKQAKKQAEKAEKTEQAENAETLENKNEGVDYKTLDVSSNEGKAANYLKNILDILGCTNVELYVSYIDNGIMINISGEGLGTIIGHRGETLDAMQLLTSLASNVGESGYYRVVLNTGDYRQRREQTLINLANKMSAQAIKTHKCRTLEPMNPYERRIIHTAVQNIEGVSSTSFGEGSARRVVIAPDGVTPKPRSNRGSGRNGSTRGRRNSGASAIKSNPSHEQLKDSENIPLYGKIEL